MKRNIISVIVILVFALTLSSCTPAATTVDTSKWEEDLKAKDAIIVDLEKKIKDLEEEVAAPIPTPTPSQSNLLMQSLDIIELIKIKDMNGLSAHVHPTNGLRFTAYPYIDTQTDQVFTAQQVASLMQNTQIIHWGDYDGSGEPIDLTYSDYYDEFIYDQDFANPHMIGNNVAIGDGNVYDNISQAYPNANFTEFYFTGFDPQFTGMDWENLRLVFEDVGGVWYLVGIIHGQWTI